MPKVKTSAKWIEAGYNLFAQEGPEALQVERIARTLGLNKSSFYHFFGTMEIFYDQLIVHHLRSVELALKDGESAQNLDPEYLNKVVKHRVTYLAQMQLGRQKGNPLLWKAYQNANEKFEQAIVVFWKNHGQEGEGRLSLRYLGFVRDAFYTRISFENFNYNFLRSLVIEAKEIIRELQHEKRIGIRQEFPRRLRLETNTGLQ